MTRVLMLTVMLAFSSVPFANAAPLLFNGNLDLTSPVEIVPGFFLPKPDGWINEGFRSITGAYEDEMSSEPWAGPAPTPVTTDGTANGPHPDGCGGPDCAVFFKPFSGNPSDGAATGHLYQDVAGTPGLTYTMTGWAGAEANALGTYYFALEFRDAANAILATELLNLNTSGLFTDNGQSFNYKQYTLAGVAPGGTATVRVRTSMVGAMGNPLGGGQAFVVDDFELTDGRTAPEPATVMLLGIGGIAAAVRRVRRRPSVQ